jgi:peptidoglycan/xylan/chitin deacetylase (PgdA/CDA1 family)
VGHAEYVTWLQLQEIQANGWIIANHTDSTGSLSGKTEAQQETSIAACRTALLAYGLTGGNYFACPAGYFDADTITALTNLGILTSRGVTDSRDCRLPPYDIWNLEAGQLNNTHTLANGIALIDSAISHKTIASIYLHAVGSASNYSVANFQGLMDYIYTQWKAGLIYPITIHDYYNLSLNDVRISKPR